VAQQAPLNRIGKEIPAVAVNDLGGGRYEIDFGTALTGWLRLKMPALLARTVVKMTFADKKLPNGTYQHFNQVSEFIPTGKPGEVFQHKFNYAGFRYVLVEGLPVPPAKEDAVAMLVESDLESAGAFECSNELFNRIHRVNQWTQRSLNLGGYYVDCPHRERMGYGDGQVATEGFMTSFNAYGYYRKWLCDWRLRQGAEGKLPHMAPFGQGGGGPGWPGLLAATTWRHYLYYGDRRVLEENFDAIRRYVDYLETLCKDNILRKYGGQWDFIGDWVPPNRGMDTDNWPGPQAAELFNNCYRIYQMDLLMRMSEALGKKDEVERCQSRLAVIRPAVHAAFYDKAAGHYVIDEQAYYVMPLMTGVVPEPERAAMLKKLEQNILVKNQGHLDTGMLGTYFMMEYLRGTGRSDLVFTMFNQTAHPGWGYMLEQGATTLWEQWNGHWSHIHSCFTSPDNWFYQGLGGIMPDPAVPGFKQIIIKPNMVGDLTWVKAHHDSPYGRIVSNWKLEAGKLTMEVTVPPNTTATIFVPAKDAASVTESGKPATKAVGVKFLRMENGAAVYAVGSGTYQFQSALIKTAK
jgi:alpha-L-rhamnosidase